MKKNAVVYGLFDGCMVPLSMCSFMNFWSSTSSDCDKQMFLLMSVAGAPGFNSIAWSQDRFGGNFFDSCLLNTHTCHWYCVGMYGCIDFGGGSMGVTAFLMSACTFVCV